jgi:hypothetical protein
MEAIPLKESMTPYEINHEVIKTPEYKAILQCRSCKSTDIGDILSLGNHKVVDFSEGDKPTPEIPLTLTLCNKCNLLQLRHTTRGDLLWGDDYGYQSGINETMCKELASITNKAEALVGLTDKDIVIDIGCNDGTLLKSYTKDPIQVGFEPSTNVGKYTLDYFLTKPSDKFLLVNDYFRKEPFLRHFDNKKAKVITAIAMFYDLDEPNKFLKDIKACLHEEGVFIVQQNYLKGMLDQCAFDNICHEHMEYYSLHSMEYLLEQNGLEVFDVSQNNINGGSFRTYIRHVGSEVGGKGESCSVDKMRKDEEEAGLTSKETYLQFAERVKHNGERLKEFVELENKKGKKVYIYGASTRGGTLLQFCGIDNKQIIGAAERNPDKWGKIMKTTGIPIVSEEEARSKADIFVVLPWFFKKEFVEREQEFIKKGGKLVFPLPKFEVYE